MAFYAGLLLMSGGVGTAPSALDSSPDDGVVAGLGKPLLGLVLAFVMLIVFLVVVAGLLSTLWYGARHRFRAAEVSSFLPPVSDVIVGLCLVGAAIQEVISSGSAGVLLVEAASAGCLLALAGANLVALTRAKEGAGPAGA